MAEWQRTFVMLKPDAVERGLIGELIGRFERKGLRIVALKLMRVSRELAERHYAEHRQKPFFQGLVDFVTSAPVVVMALEGEEAIAQVRALVGATRPSEATPGSIRGDLAMSVPKNLIHASDSPESAERELGLFFSEDDYVSWQPERERWLYE